VAEERLRVEGRGCGRGRPSIAAKTSRANAAIPSATPSAPWRTWLSIWKLSSRCDPEVSIASSLVWTRLQRTSFALARAYLDQLEREQGLDGGHLSAAAAHLLAVQ